MEQPLKNTRIQDPDIRGARESGSQMRDGLFTSEKGTQSSDGDRLARVTGTATSGLSQPQRRAASGNEGYADPPQPLHRVFRRAEATVTVTAPQVVLNVNDGTSTVLETTIAPVSTDTVLSLSDLGSLTLPANLTSIPTVTEARTNGTSTTDVSSTISGDVSGTASSSTISTLTGASNTTFTDTITSITTTVTVTETSTLQVSLRNGTLFPVVVTTVTSNGDEDSPDDVFTLSNTATGIVVTDDEFTSPTAFATTAGGAGGAPVTATSEAPAATSTESSGGGGGGGATLSPQQQQVVGGVVGSIAGVALILVMILFVLRRYRAKLKAQGRLPEQLAERNMLSGGDDAPGMSQRGSVFPFPAAIASSLRRLRPLSSHTQATDITASTVPESEKGFQRIAGRKIAPVLSTGGDGYGGDYGVFDKEAGVGASGHQRNESSLAGSSFYRDSRGFYGGRGGESPVYPPSPTIGSVEQGAGMSTTRDFAGQAPRTPSQVSVTPSRLEGTAALRPSPARTPVTVSPAPSSIRLPIQQTPDLNDAPPLPAFAPGLHVPDGVGRSLAQQDGSRISARSRGSGRSRFAENM